MVPAPRLGGGSSVPGCVDCGEREPATLAWDDLRNPVVSTSLQARMAAFPATPLDGELEGFEIRCHRCRLQRLVLEGKFAGRWLEPGMIEQAVGELRYWRVPFPEDRARRYASISTGLDEKELESQRRLAQRERYDRLVEFMKARRGTESRSGTVEKSTTGWWRRWVPAAAGIAVVALIGFPMAPRPGGLAPVTDIAVTRVESPSAPSFPESVDEIPDGTSRTASSVDSPKVTGDETAPGNEITTEAYPEETEEAASEIVRPARPTQPAPRAAPADEPRVMKASELFRKFPELRPRGTDQG